jgi:hypothetical protein
VDSVVLGLNDALFDFVGMLAGLKVALQNPQVIAVMELITGVAAEAYLKRGYFWATHNKSKPIIDVAKTLKSHWNGIVNYFEFLKSNEILVAFNGLIKSTKTAARGFRSLDYFIAIIYLRLGRLEFNLSI